MEKAKEPGFYQAVSLQRFKEAKKEVFAEFEKMALVLGVINDKLDCLLEVKEGAAKNWGSKNERFINT